MTEKDQYRILVMSDTHGDYRRMNAVVNREFPFDMLIHCGDSQMTLDSVLDRRDDYELVSIQGNCDMFSRDALVCTPRVGSVRLYVTHGHRLGVHDGFDRLLREAKKEGASVAVYGHTHIPVNYYSDEDQILVLNPGSLMYPKQYPRIPTYAVLTIARNHFPQAQIVECEEWM